MVLKSRLLAPDWSADGDPEKEAKCRKFPLPTKNNPSPDTDPFFEDDEEAQHICNGTYDKSICPFRNRCLEIALVNNEQAGMFGGMTVLQRRWIRRQSKRDDPRPDPWIDRSDWWQPDTWRHLVPTHADLIAEMEENDREEDTEE